MKATDNFFSSKRTWSTLKDEILESYLAPYLSKISRTGLPVRIADCFAGKGRFDDGELGSPIYIASAIEKALQRDPTSNIQGVFIEKKYFDQLRKNLTPYANCNLLKGEYEDRVQKFVDIVDAPKLNLFLYVDPYGIKHLPFQHFESVSALGLNSLELLLNFNTFGFLREGCRLLKLRDFECDEDSEVYEPDEANNVERMNAIAHGNYWQKILTEYHEGQISMADAEKEFSVKYVDALKTLFSYIVNIPIKQKRSHLPKYRLIFGTNSGDGLLLMADKMSRTWKAFVLNERRGQRVLFDDLDFPDYAASGFAKPDETIWNLLSEPYELKNLLVKLIEQFGIAYSESELINIVRRLVEANTIIVEREPSTTPTGRKAISYDYRKYNIVLKRG